MKKFLSVFVAVCLLIVNINVGSFKVSAAHYTSGDFTYFINEDYAFICDCSYDEGGTLTVPSSYRGKPVYGIMEESFSNCNAIKIIVPNSVENIQEKAFYNCTSLEEIELPDSVKWIGVDAFYGTQFYNNEANWENDVLYCGNHLIKANDTIDGSYTVREGTQTIAWNAFYNCSKLDDVELPVGLKVIGEYAFYGTHMLNSNVVVPESVHSIGFGAFEYSGICEITLPFLGSGEIGEDYYGQSATHLGYIFGAENYSDYPYGGQSLRKVFITDTSLSIPSYAFYEYPLIEEVYLSESITNVGAYAFYGCERLSTIVMDNVYIVGENAFEGTLWLQNQAGEMVSAGKCFYKFNGEVSTSTVEINDGILGIADRAFENFEIVNISLPNTLIHIGNRTFFGCANITEIIIPNSVKTISEYAFYNTSLNSIWYNGSENEASQIIISNDGNAPLNEATWHYNICLSNQHTFSGECDDSCGNCEWIRAVSVEHNYSDDVDVDCNTCGYVKPELSYKIINNSYVEIIGLEDDFSGSIQIPSEIEGLPVTSIGDYAFENCTGLTNVTISEKIESIGLNVFDSCTSLININVDSNNLYYESVDGVLYDESNNILIKCPTKKTGAVYIQDGTLEIADEAFAYCSNLTSVIIPNSVSSIGSGAFINCLSIENITVPNGVTHIKGYTFYFCKALTSITLPKTVEKVDNYAFAYCSNISSIILYEGVTSIGDHAFSNCDNLVSVSIPSTVTNIGDYVFSNCYNLNSIDIPVGITHISNGMFSDCDDLCIEIPSHITSIGYDAFYGCNSLTSVNIPSRVTEIGAGAFSSCINLTSVSIGAGIKTVDNYTFNYCKNLKSIVIPQSITNIGKYAFNDCEKLNDVWYLGSAEDFSQIYIEEGNEAVLNIEWHYDSCSVGAEHIYDNACDDICNICNGERVAPHCFEWKIDIHPSCGETGIKHEECSLCSIKRNEDTIIKATGQHIYDNDCDKICNNCDFTREVSEHNYGIDYTCDICKYSKAPGVPYVDIIYANSVTLQSVAGLEYSIDMVNWQLSPVFSDLEPNTTYTFYQRVAESENSCVSEASVGLQVTTKKVFIVTYDANGGTNAPDLQIKTEEVALILSAEEPIRAGYIFAGWSVSTDGNVMYNSGDEYTADSDIVLYAKWLKICTNCEGNGEYGKTETCEICVGEGVTYSNCTQCGGDGREFIRKTCYACNGSCFIGVNLCPSCDGRGYIDSYPTCHICEGSGKVASRCNACNGSGTKYNIYTCGICGGTGIVKGLERIEITQLPETLTFLEGKDELSVIGGKITLYYDDNTSQMMDIIPSMVRGFDNTAVGSQILTVTYNGKTATYNIEIISKELESIELIDKGLKKEYLEGKDTLDVTNGTIRLHYNNGTYSDIALTAGMVSGFNNTVVGEQILTVTYGDFTDTYKVEIIAKTLESIAVTTLPNKTHYLVGKDVFSAEGGKVTLYYNNDTSDIIDLNSSMVSGFSNQTVGVITLTVTYKGKTDTFNITVDEKTLTSISVTAKPNKLSYLEGESFSKTGLVVTAYYDNDTSAAVSNYSISGYSSTPGTKTITVAYNGKTDTFTVTVLAKSLSSIAVTTKPSKLTYTEGEAFDKSGMVVTAYYNNNTSGVVTDYSVSGYTSTPGTKTITVTYGGKNATFTVTVKSGVPLSITSSKFTVSGNKISKISAGTTVSALLNGISEGAYCKVYSGNSVVSSSSNVGTGMVVKIMDGNTIKASYTVIVTGDTNGDGNITVTDMIAIKAHVLKKSTLSGVYATAADTNGDSGISITDFIQVKAKILGKGSITAR